MAQAITRDFVGQKSFLGRPAGRDPRAELKLFRSMSSKVPLLFNPS